MADHNSWIAYLAANITMGAFASAIGAYGLLAQQLGFATTTLLGLQRAGWLDLERKASPWATTKGR